MNRAVLASEVQKYIQQQLNQDLNFLIFKKSPFSTVTMHELVKQISGKKNAYTKLPTWFETSGIYYPEKVSLEQTSSEKTASYKSSLIKGKSLVDLTGGFGVDSFYFSKQFDAVIHLEKNESLSEIVSFNYKQLGASNIECKTEDAETFLHRNQKTFDWIYADPSRRDDHLGKVFLLSECTPNIPELLDIIWQRTQNLLLKTSPLLDIQQGINELQHVKEVHVVAVKNEVKELIWILEKDYKGSIKIFSVNIEKEKTDFFSFFYQEEKETKVFFSNPLNYLYEPYAAVLKSGAFKTISQKYKVSKIGINSHLYTSEALIQFPGRIFEIQESLPFHKKTLKKRFSKAKAHVTTRNFPWSVAKLRKELQILDGGEVYLFFTTDLKDNHLVIICKKL
ncbi:THUMP-like domain-containing protein [Flavobacteriaceae bacterium M23B6Z8]